MLSINRTMQLIRCSRYEFLVKKGSISNYSFHLKDEEKSGILEVVFEKIHFPLPQDQFEERVLNELSDVNREEIRALLDQLLELEIVQSQAEVPLSHPGICVIVNGSSENRVKEAFKGQPFKVEIFTLDEEAVLDELGQLHLHGEKADLTGFEYVVLLHDHFSPNTFYKMNKVCLSLNKKLLISYLDGNEGIVVPLLNFNQVGCYNDFEILRESSFYNLLDYQVMKEQLLEKGAPDSPANHLHLSLLVDHTVLLLNQYSEKTNINYYAYSLDFERMVNTKSRLLKFPKCPSCQSDKNLVHAFI